MNTSPLQDIVYPQKSELIVFIRRRSKRVGSARREGDAGGLVLFGHDLPISTITMSSLKVN